MDHLQPVLEPGAAVRDLREVVLAHRLLLRPRERTVVGRDRRQDVGPHRVPEHVLVLLRARRRRVHVLRALEVRPLEERVVDEEVLRACLAPDVPAGVSRSLDRLDRLAARDVDDVQRRAGDVRQLDRAVRRLALRLGRPRQRVPVRLRVARGKRLLHQHVDRVAVLRVHHHERTGLRRDLHRLEERLVVDHQGALVRHEQLVGGDALLRKRSELLERPALGEVGDRHVVAHVDQGLALALAVPRVERRGEALARRLDDEVDMARRAAERCGCVPRLDVVDRRRAAERHVEVRVRIDAAGKQHLPRRVDHVVGGEVERFADEGDPLAVHEHVCDVIVGRGHDAAPFDENGHADLPPSARVFYLPPSFSATIAGL